MPDAIYRSAAPSVVEAWEDTQRRYKEWHSAVGAWGDAYKHDGILITDHGDRKWVIGLRGDDAPGPEWRWSKQADCWVPDKRTKAGKAVDATLESLRVDKLGHVPGMPARVVGPGRMYQSGFEYIDGVLWVTWGCSAEEVESQAKFDGNLWERAKASAYYLAVEGAMPSA